MAERKPQKTNVFLPYRSAAMAKGMSATVLAMEDTDVTSPIIWLEKPILLR